MVQLKRTKVGTERGHLWVAVQKARMSAAWDSFPVFHVSRLVPVLGVGLGERQLVPRPPESGRPCSLYSSLLWSLLCHATEVQAEAGRVCIPSCSSIWQQPQQAFYWIWHDVIMLKHHCHS